MFTGIGIIDAVGIVSAFASGVLSNSLAREIIAQRKKSKTNKRKTLEAERKESSEEKAKLKAELMKSFQEFYEHCTKPGNGSFHTYHVSTPRDNTFYLHRYLWENNELDPDAMMKDILALAKFQEFKIDEKRDDYFSLQFVGGVDLTIFNGDHASKEKLLAAARRLQSMTESEKEGLRTEYRAIAVNNILDDNRKELYDGL